jgi:hypothetical protein
MRCRIDAGALCIWLMFGTTNTAHAQNSRPVSQSPFVRMDLIPVTTGTDEPQQRRALEMARKGDLERQARVVTDTNKLFKLAEELKDSVSKSNVNILSIEVLQKANEIEKLAHSVKEKMRGPN